MTDAPAHALTTDEYAAWLARYRDAWQRRDPALAAALFTADATYRETPYDAPMVGRGAIADYWARVTSGQRDVRFEAQVLAVQGSIGLAHWHAEFTAVPGGEAITLDGIFRCRFADGTSVAMLEEWWNLRVVPAK